MISKEWDIYFFVSFEHQLGKLKQEVAKLKEKDPEGYKKHEKTKLLKKIYLVVFKDIPTDPRHPKFNLGKTLGKKYRFYKRAKDNLPSRYRLLFRYNSNKSEIVIVWMNDEFSLRKKGVKTTPTWFFSEC